MSKDTIQREVMGLLIVPPSREIKQLLKLGTKHQPQKLCYSIIISKGRIANPLFISTPSIRELLNRGQHNKGFLIYLVNKYKILAGLVN